MADENEMMRLPGINVEHVTRYGKRFLELIRIHEELYEKLLEDKPFEDPNHQEVTVISDDEPEEDQDDFLEDDEGGISLEESRSSYFTVPEEVQRFNDQCMIGHSSI